MGPPYAGLCWSMLVVVIVLLVLDLAYTAYAAYHSSEKGFWLNQAQVPGEEAMQVEKSSCRMDQDTLSADRKL